MDSKTFPEYTEEQLKDALDSLLQGSSDPAFDGRHLFGFGDPNHKLSKLQAITATRILDYENYMVSSSTTHVLKHREKDLQADIYMILDLTFRFE